LSPTFAEEIGAPAVASPVFSALVLGIAAVVDAVADAVVVVAGGSGGGGGDVAGLRPSPSASTCMASADDIFFSEFFFEKKREKERSSIRTAHTPWQATAQGCRR
jgi:hypothetical protein